jgi:hypothetical protein
MRTRPLCYARSVTVTADGRVWEERPAFDKSAIRESRKANKKEAKVGVALAVRAPRRRLLTRGRGCFRRRRGARS